MDNEVATLGLDDEGGGEREGGSRQLQSSLQPANWIRRNSSGVHEMMGLMNLSVRVEYSPVLPNPKGRQ